MDKICTIAILLAFLIAIAAAFIAIPNAAAALLILGAVGGLNTAYKPDYRLRIYGAAIVLTVGAASLTSIPVVGVHLATIFAGVGLAFIGASVVGITLAIAVQVKANLTAGSTARPARA